MSKKDLKQIEDYKDRNHGTESNRKRNSEVTNDDASLVIVKSGNKSSYLNGE